MFRNRAAIAWLVVLLFVGNNLLTSCSILNKYSNTPVGVARKMMDSIQENNTSKYLDSVSPKDRSRPGFFFYSQLIQGVVGAFSGGEIKSSGLKISFTNMKYEEVSNNGKAALVSINGKMRDLNLALEQDFSYNINVAKFENEWLVVLSEDVLAEVSATPTSTTVPIAQKYSRPPETDEQKVAANIIDQYLISINADYKNGLFETVKIDESFATVKMTAESKMPNMDNWLEFDISIQLRFIGGKWNADGNSIIMEYTQKGLATATAVEKGTQSSQDNAIKETAQAVQAKIPGILITAKGDSIVVENPIGNVKYINPLAGRYESIKYENIDISPDRKGFYFTIDTNDNGYSFSPGVFFSDFDGNNTRLLKQYGGQSYVKGLSVSPDSTKIALTLNSFVQKPRTIQVIPTSGGDGKIIWTEKNRNYAYSPSWTSDSNSLYIGVGSGSRPNSIQEIYQLGMDGSLTKIRELDPTVANSDSFLVDRQIAISPNGEDVALGGLVLDLYNINNKTNISLYPGPEPICNPIWKDGETIIYASRIFLFFYNIKTGETDLLYPLDILKVDSVGCPTYDWLPQ